MRHVAHPAIAGSHLARLMAASAAFALAVAVQAQDAGKQGSATNAKDAQEIAAPTPAPAAMASADNRTTYPAEDEALYEARFNRLLEAARTGAGLASYDPLEPVAGAENARPLPMADEPALSAEALAKAESYAAARNSNAFIVVKDGIVQHERYFGDTDRTTPIVSRSLAKPVTALLVGRAIVEGHIESLDQPVADFITEWQGDPAREKILVRHLLDMRTGLLPQGFSREPQDILNRAYLHPRHDEVIINDYPVTHEAGTRYEYSNANAELVAPVIERATGMRYSEYLTEALLEPIGAMGGEVWVNREGGTAHSGCCLLLPAQSWVRMAMLVMNDGMWEGERLLPEGYAEAMRTATEQNPHYGMGVWVAGPYVEKRGFAHPSVPYGKVDHAEPYLDRDLALFDGNANQVVYMIPSQDMIVLRTGNAPPKDAPWDNTVLPNLLIRDAAARTGEPLPEPQAVPGKAKSARTR
ncbi:MAG: serine hydrolase [Erythrobacter sp.]|uniref:serine hydrolase domain-containing protein n=1 Tax=Erythrobacter sp. TaxID=1042 RepID=UPI0032EB5C3D